MEICNSVNIFDLEKNHFKRKPKTKLKNRHFSKVKTTNSKSHKKLKKHIHIII